MKAWKLCLFGVMLGLLASGHANDTPQNTADDVKAPFADTDGADSAEPVPAAPRGILKGEPLPAAKAPAHSVRFQEGDPSSHHRRQLTLARATTDTDSTPASQAPPTTTPDRKVRFDPQVQQILFGRTSSPAELGFERKEATEVGEADRWSDGFSKGPQDLKESGGRSNELKRRSEKKARWPAARLSAKAAQARAKFLSIKNSRKLEAQLKEKEEQMKHMHEHSGRERAERDKLQESIRELREDLKQETLRREQAQANLERERYKKVLEEIKKAEGNSHHATIGWTLHGAGRNCLPNWPDSLNNGANLVTLDRCKQLCETNARCNFIQFSRSDGRCAMWPSCASMSNDSPWDVYRKPAVQDQEMPAPEQEDAGPSPPPTPEGADDVTMGIAIGVSVLLFLVILCGVARHFSPAKYGKLKDRAKGLLLNSRRGRQQSFIDHEDWQKLDKIGQGAFGSVYSAVNNRTGGLFAIKELWIGRSDSPKIPSTRQVKRVAKFQREIDTLRDLEHKHIVKHLGSAKSGGYFYLYLEYVGGGTLQELLDSLAQPMELTLSRNYTMQLLKGLQYLHDNGVIHRDLKPANVLITIKGTLKLADFGTAFHLDSMTHTTQQTVCGTPLFMAPEVITQEKHTTSSDIWSLGVIIFNVITARYPFDKGTTFSLLVSLAMNRAEVVWPDDIHTRVKRFIASCLRRDPAARPSAKELITKLEAIEKAIANADKTTINVRRAG